MVQGGAMAPFRQPVFRAIWAATLVSNFGAMIQSVGAAWLMASISGSPRMVALIQSSASLPIMLLALFAGAIADSFDRRLVMLCAQGLMLAASTLLAAFAWAGHIAPWGLLAATLAVGVGTALNGPSWQASLRSQVPIADLPAAVALNSIGFNLARSLGPAIGGALMALFGPSVNFTVNALSYVARHEAPLGIVYETDAWAEKGVRIVGIFPEASHPTIDYPAALVRGGNPAARGFAAYLQSPAAKATFRRYGFRTFG
ncbi:MAG: MFS transporter [Sphingomonas sp.]|nr:MAG: MFS transporter [Sphingomonas sp.]